jgi:predicted enzyme related to lactoylglutathione lyase
MQRVALFVQQSEWQKGLSWYKKAFPNTLKTEAPEMYFAVVEIGRKVIHIVGSDEAAPHQVLGTAFTWQTENLIEELDRFKSLGSLVLKEPVVTQDGFAICHVTDVFGYAIAITGRYKALSGGALSNRSERKNKNLLLG